MENVRIGVWENCFGTCWNFGIYKGKVKLMRNLTTNHGSAFWQQKKAAIRNAKAMAKCIGVPYDPEIIKQHGC